MSFWDIVWFILISFALMAYLIVMFNIVRDLFRDPRATGVERAAWILALIVVPLLASLVYVVVKGRGMAERQVRSPEELRSLAAAGQPAGRGASTLDHDRIPRVEHERYGARPLG